MWSRLKSQFLTSFAAQERFFVGCAGFELGIHKFTISMHRQGNPGLKSFSSFLLLFYLFSLRYALEILCVLEIICVLDRREF